MRIFVAWVALAAGWAALVLGLLEWAQPASPHLLLAATTALLGRHALRTHRTVSLMHRLADHGAMPKMLTADSREQRDRLSLDEAEWALYERDVLAPIALECEVIGALVTGGIRDFYSIALLRRVYKDRLNGIWEDHFMQHHVQTCRREAPDRKRYADFEALVRVLNHKPWWRVS